jgi:hypothetical protein
MSLLIDTQDKLCLYNNKEKEKSGRILLENSNKNYKISYFNKLLMGHTEEYLLFTCNKDKSVKETKNLLNLIKFQKQKEKPVLDQYISNTNSSTGFNNYFQNCFSNINVESKKSYLIIFKIKEIIMKCYPQMIMVNKKGYSFKKIMLKYDLKNLPMFDKKDKMSSLIMLDFDKKKNRLGSSSLKKVEEGSEEEIVGIKKQKSMRRENDQSLNEDELK